MTRLRVLLGFIFLGLVLVTFSYQPDGAPAQSTPREAEAVQAEDLFPLNKRTHTFRVTDGEKLDQRLPLSLRPAKDGEAGEWVLEFSDLNTIYLSVDEGNIMMERVDFPPDGQAVEYDPPLRMLPSEIRPHVKIEEESKARIYNLETGELERKGTVRHEVKFATRSSFVTDVGEYEGYMIPIEQQIDVPWASVRMELTGGFVPEVGIVYRRVDYTRKIFGFFGKTTRRTAVLSELEE